MEEIEIPEIEIPEIAIAVKQPWAELLVQGVKKIEIRTFPIPKKYLNKRIAIHASKKIDDRRFIWNHFEGSEWQGIMKRTGGIIGSLIFHDDIRYTCHGHFAEYRPMHLNDLDEYKGGLHGFVARAPIQFKNMIPLIGRLGFFKVDQTDMNVDCIGGITNELQDG